MLSLNKHSIIRTIYLYLFALVGLALVISGFVKFIDMGLKMYVFTKAEEPERIQQKYYYSTPIPVARLEAYQGEGDLTEDEKATLKSLIANYKEWQEEENKIDYLTSRRHEQASGNLSMLLVGLPLYLYHWRIIKRETKEKED